MHPRTPSAALGIVTTALFLASLLPSIVLATCNPTDTIYVNNTRTSPGGEDGGCTPNTAFRTINAALTHFVGGTHRVIAVMGTGVPYRESPEVKIFPSDSGSVSTRSVLFARGTVIIDCGDAPPDNSSPAETEPNWWVPRYAAANSTNKLWAAKDTTTDSDHDCNQVVMGSDALGMERRYPENEQSDLTLMTVGQSHYNPAVDSVYVFFDDPNHSYHQDGGYLCTRNGILVQAANFVVDGFTVLRSKADGILVDHITARNVTIKNCIVEQSRNDGIDFTRAIACTALANASAYNTGNGIYVKTKSGAGNDPAEDCVVIGNTAHHNDNHASANGGINGIRIGNQTSAAAALDGHHLIENNSAYSNEDSGFDVHGSNENRFRYNRSWSNGDHGFDHLYSTGTVHVGGLAYKNDTNGISVEPDCTDTRIENCIMVDNGQDTGDEDPELEVAPTAQSGLVLDHNLYWRPTRTGPDANDKVLVDFEGGNQGSSSFCEDTTECYKTVAQLRLHTAFEDNGVEGDPAFTDGAAADFTLQSGSKAIDEANSSATDWLGKDVRGFNRHDYAGKANSGSGSRTYDDMGPYEYDVAPAAVANLNADVIWSADMDLSWTAPGDDGAVGTAQLYDIRASTSAITDANWGSATQLASSEPTPSVAGSAEGFNAYTFSYNTWYYLRMKSRDADNQLWSPLSNQIHVKTLPCCQSGSRAVRDRREAIATAASTSAAAGAVTKVVILEAGGSAGEWTIEDGVVEEWLGNGGSEGPFVALQEPDGAGGWRDRVQFPYLGGPLGITLPHGGVGRVVVVGPTGDIRLSSEVIGQDGAAYSLASAEHSRLGDMTGSASNEPVELGLGDVVNAYFESGEEAGVSAGSAFVIVGRAGQESSPTSAKSLRRSQLPSEFALSQNQPNPASANTTIQFALPERAHVRLEVFDVHGRLVARVVNRELDAGFHSIVWDCSGQSGQRVRPGVYMYRMTGGKFRAERKLVLIP